MVMTIQDTTFAVFDLCKYATKYSQITTNCTTVRTA